MVDGDVVIFQETKYLLCYHLLVY